MFVRLEKARVKLRPFPTPFRVIREYYFERQLAHLLKADLRKRERGTA